MQKWLEVPENKEVHVKKLKSWISRIESKLRRFPELKFPAEQIRLASLKEQLAKLEN